MYTSPLAAPLQVGPLTLKNRIIMTAMHTVYPESGGMPSDRFKEFYWRRAEGGAALITVGACRFDQKGARLSCMSLADDSMIRPWQSFTAGMRERGCPVAVQLYHAGRYLPKDAVPDGGDALAPSAVFTPFTRETAPAMSVEEIQQVIRAWAEGARRAREAGFDAVEISASAGYLISQFLSPLTNVREDEYGGSFEKRCRFPLEVIRAVRTAVGEDYPVLLRYSAHTLVPEAGGSSEAADFAALAAQAGIDLLNLTGGWHESRIPQLTREMPAGGLLNLAEKIKARVDIPVAMANRMHSFRMAEQAVALGQCDLIAIGRALIAEPDLPKNRLAGTPEKNRPCLSCNQGCLAGTFFDKPVRCFNGLAGREYELDTRPVPPENRKKVLVIGGGPAGMECALRAAQKGHRVTLRERSERLGGQLKLAEPMPLGYAFTDLIAWYTRELASAGVQIEFNCAVTPETAEGFDTVVLAAGREYKALPKKDILPISPDAVPVYTHEQLLAENLLLPRRVAVIGGSFVGMETARKLLLDAAPTDAVLRYQFRYGIEPDTEIKRAITSSARQVALFEKGKLAAGYESGIAWTVYGDLNAFGCELHAKTEVKEITAEGVVTAEGLWPCDAVVFCVGTNPNEELRAALEARCADVRVIGNAQKPGRAIDAIGAGCECGLTI